MNYDALKSKSPLLFVGKKKKNFNKNESESNF